VRREDRNMKIDRKIDYVERGEDATSTFSLGFTVLVILS
jgi:hypothetical protein